MSSAGLDPHELAWLAQHAGPALARRDRRGLPEARARWIEWMLSGTIGLIGLVVLDWSGVQAALVLLASHWLGWIIDLLQWRLRAAELERARAQDYDDSRVWQLVALLRGRRKQAPDARGDPPMAVSLGIDLIAGGAATALMWRGLATAGTPLTEVVLAPTLLAGIVATLASGAVLTLRSRLRRESDGSVALPAFRCGQRGLGLLVVVFALMAVGGGSLGGHGLMLTVYGFMLLMGGIELTWGVPAQRAEANWLREQRRRAGAAGETC